MHHYHRRTVSTFSSSHGMFDWIYDKAKQFDHVFLVLLQLTLIYNGKKMHSPPLLSYAFKIHAMRLIIPRNGLSVGNRE